MNSRRWLGLLCCSAMAMQLMAADPESGASAASQTVSGPETPAISVKQLEELRKKIAEQQKQIELLQKSVADQQTLLDNTMRIVAASASGTSSNAAAPQLQTIGNTAGTPFSLAPAARAGQAKGGDVTASPLSFGIGAAQFTPFGFVDLTWFGRSTAVGSSLGTNFAGIPYNNTAAGRIGENNFSTQNSRLGMRVDSTLAGAKVLGYFEADFLGNQPTNVFVTSNSDTFRMRNVFVDVKKGPLEILGGQDWSLLTPGRVGISPLPSDLFYSQDMDTNYQVGLTWSRQTQFRVAYHPNDHVHMAVSLENPQQYIGGGSGAPQIIYPAAFATNTGITNQFDNGSSSYGAPNSMPDIIAKAAFDAKPGGLLQHIEVAGLVRRFKYFNPLLNSALGQSFSKIGGGGSVNGNFEVVKNVHLIANTFFSDGGGRYLFGMIPDLVVRPDGNMSLVHAFSTVDGVEANITKKMLLYSYYGGAYAGRNTSIDTGNKLVGYGLNSAQNRDIQEVSFGLVPTFWKSPKYGALQLITQYSYLWRAPWIQNNPRNAKSNMVWIDLRYTIP